ncbi:DUF4235 domain-containing protein [Haloferula sargassicola]|uniref:DUF4235 domain-containing protein n=1 Tax=Haloferula sargassicola TaxID=490096 RepID=A0ABP9UJT2_9BACT
MGLHRSSRLLRMTAVGAGFVLPAIAAKLARMGAGSLYRRVSKIDPPRNPARVDVSWKEAIAWTALAGVTGAFARLVARRSLPLIGLPAEGYDLEDEADALD